MPELSEFERIAYADQCTNTSEIISVKALDNMILVFSIFLSPHRHSLFFLPFPLSNAIIYSNCAVIFVFHAKWDWICVPPLSTTEVYICHFGMYC